MLESKRQSIVLDLETHIENQEILRFNRNCHGGGVACYIKNDINYELDYFLPNKTENITSDILMLHKKPVTIGITYIHPTQPKCLDIFRKNLPKFDTSYCEI